MAIISLFYFNQEIISSVELNYQLVKDNKFYIDDKAYKVNGVFNGIESGYPYTLYNLIAHKDGFRDTTRGTIRDAMKPYTRKMKIENLNND